MKKMAPPGALASADAATPKSAATILREAAAIIATTGLAKDAWARDRGGRNVNGASLTAVCHCAGDAIFLASREPPSDQQRAFSIFARAIGTSDIAGWNDAPERTQAEVVAALRKAADLAEAAQ